MTIDLISTPWRCSAFARDRERSASRPAPSPPSTTCLENFSPPGLWMVTTHFDWLSSSEANSVISFARAVVATAVAEVTDCIGSSMRVWKLSLPSRAAVHPHRIFFRALDALAVDDGGGRAGFAGGGFATLHVERVVDAIERAVPTPQIEIIVDRRARRQVLGDCPPLAAGAQDGHQAVDDLAQFPRPPVAATLGRRNERLRQRPFLVGQIARITQLAAIVAPTIFVPPHPAIPSK